MAQREEGKVGALPLHWISYAPAAPRAWLAIVPGYCDHGGRYAKVMEELAQKHGIATLAVDLRGHGQSGGRPSDVVHFADYLTDVDQLWALATERARATPRFLFGHSMGGLVATQWVATARPQLAGLILTSPFFGFAKPPPALAVLGARVLLAVAPALRIPNGIKVDQLSSDEAWKRSSAADPLYHRTTTARWFFEVAGAQARALEDAARVEAPLWVGMAGADSLASTAVAQATLGKVASKDVTLRVYPGMRHEILNEVGGGAVSDDIARWILAHC